MKFYLSCPYKGMAYSFLNFYLISRTKLNSNYLFHLVFDPMAKAEGNIQNCILQ